MNEVARNEFGVAHDVNGERVSVHGEGIVLMTGDVTRVLQTRPPAEESQALLDQLDPLLGYTGCIRSFKELPQFLQ